MRPAFCRFATQPLDKNCNFIQGGPQYTLWRSTLWRGTLWCGTMWRHYVVRHSVTRRSPTHQNEVFHDPCLINLA